jgi:type IV secretory pathway VirB4 component
VTFDPTLPMITLDLSRISGSDQLIAMVMARASARMEAALADPEAGPRWVIYDEAWRLLRQPAHLARMQSQWKLSRGLGIANLMIIHRLSDLEAVGAADSEARALALGLLADCSTKIIYQQESSEAPRHRAGPGPVGNRTGRAARSATRRRVLAGRPASLRR